MYAAIQTRNPVNPTPQPATPTYSFKVWKGDGNRLCVKGCPPEGD
ncbi:hypothetical protein [Microcoleus sp.]